PKFAERLHDLLVIVPGLHPLLPLARISDYHFFPVQPHLPAMITQHKTRITTTVTSGLTKLIQYLSLHLLTALAVTPDRHRGNCLSLLHRQPHLLPPSPLRAAAVSTLSSRFLYEATNTLWSRFSV